MTDEVPDELIDELTDEPAMAPDLRGPLTVVRVHGGHLLRTEGLCDLRIDADPAVRTRIAPSADLTLPIATGGARAVYLAQTLEHLALGAVLRLLLESHRVLAMEGRLVVELPDFEAILARWARGDLDDARAAAAFCSYRRPGDPANADAPRIAPEALREMRDRLSPMRLAIELCNLVTDREPRYRFERQSAWSRAELADVLRSVGFEAIAVRPAPVEAPAAAPATEPAADAPRITCFAAATPRHPASAAGRRFRDGLRLAKRGQLAEALELLQAAVTDDPTLAEAHYRLLWDLHARKLRHDPAQTIAPSPGFAADGHHVGLLPAADVAAVRDVLADAPIVRVTARDHAPGYMANANLSPEAERAINHDNQYLALEPAALARIQPLLSALVAPVRACLGTPWRVVNLRAWRTAANAARVEANGWHRDEPYPPTVRKIILYLSGAGPRIGTTEIVQPGGARFLVDGPPGTFLVFKNLELLHRGVPPTHGERSILEVTVASHAVDDVRPVCAGQNADFPLCPWMCLEPWMPLAPHRPTDRDVPPEIRESRPGPRPGP